MLDPRQKLRRNTLLALFGTIVIVQNLVPVLGNIPIGPLSITLIHITVIVAAIVLGPVQGMIIGGIWGMITFIRAFIWQQVRWQLLLYESADFGSSANLSRGGCRLWFFMDEKNTSQSGSQW